MYVLIFFSFLLVQIFSSPSHFSRIPTGPDGTNALLAYPLKYDPAKTLYQMEVSIKNVSSTIMNFPMGLDMTTSYIYFQQKNISFNSTKETYSNLTLTFEDNVSIKNQTILIEIDSRNYEEFSSNDYHGIFGLGLNSFENDTKTNLLTCRKVLVDMQSQRLISDNILSLYLGSSPLKSNETLIYFGGYNQSLIPNQASFYTHPINNNSWAFNLLGMEMVYVEEDLIKGSVYSNITTKIDITTPNIMLPEEILIKFISTCNNVYKTCYIQSGVNTLYCIDQYTAVTKNYPYIAFFFTDQLYLALDSQLLTYNCGKSSTGLQYCYLKIGLSDENNTILLGQLFLKNVYTIFNFDNNSIGFAFENLPIVNQNVDVSMNYTFYALLSIWGLTMIGSAIYFKTYLIKLNIMTNKITKIFYEKIRSAIRGHQEDMIDLDESDEDSEENLAPNNQNNNNNLNDNF